MTKKIRELHSRIIDKIHYDDQERQRAWINFITYHRVKREERKKLRYAPAFCVQSCEKFWYCRDPERKYRCRKGCLILNEKRKKKPSEH